MIDTRTGEITEPLTAVTPHSPGATPPRDAGTPAGLVPRATSSPAGSTTDEEWRFIAGAPQ